MRHLNVPGIYKITNTVNGKFYIGSSAKMWSRWAQHRSLLKHGKHGNPLLQNSYNKHGKEVFEFSVVVFCSVGDLLLFEQKFLTAHWDNGERCYNIGKVAEATMRGRTHSLATRRVMSINNSGPGNPRYGVTLDSETRRRIGNSHKGNTYRLGMPLSAETKKKMSEKGLERYRLNPALRGKLHYNYGRSVSEETRKKLSIASSGENNPNFGRVYSEEECKEKWGGENNGMYGRKGELHPCFGKPSPNLGLIYSEEAKANMKAAQNKLEVKLKHAKLTPQQVEDIKAEVGNQKEIGKKYGISQTQVSRIKRGKRWADLTNPV